MNDAVLDVSASAELTPLQFGGGLIELAILFPILAVVTGVLGGVGLRGSAWR